jgi:hypothetical protein
MGRYNTTNVILDKFDKRIAGTTIISIPFDSNDIYIRTTSLERLDKLAATFYGDVADWYKIASANGLGKGTLWIPAEKLLRIPQVPNIDEYITMHNKNR